MFYDIAFFHNPPLNNTIKTARIAHACGGATNPFSRNYTAHITCLNYSTVIKISHTVMFGRIEYFEHMLQYWKILFNTC